MKTSGYRIGAVFLQAAIKNEKPCQHKLGSAAEIGPCQRFVAISQRKKAAFQSGFLCKQAKMPHHHLFCSVAVGSKL
ncbi:hypothetical protein [Oryzifoliimicrobium ureilyticus]|uniref:hypothetical protein n=1 Tax=Oryzifoliimicrobium ureilyticus TaxID=3113724 RepID=UPI00307640F1